MRLNFTFTVYRQKDREGGWGRFNKTTEVWTGMMGLLQWGGFDIAATMFSIKEKRWRFLCIKYILLCSVICIQGQVRGLHVVRFPVPDEPGHPEPEEPRAVVDNVLRSVQGMGLGVDRNKRIDSGNHTAW